MTRPDETDPRHAVDRAAARDDDPLEPAARDVIGLDPASFRALATRAVELVSDALGEHERAPARRWMPRALREQLLAEPLPTVGRAPAEILARVEREVLAYPMGNNSPRFFAWVNSTAAPLGILGELLAAAHNPSVAGGDHSATHVERVVVRWLRELVGLEPGGAGLLTSGGSVANLIGLGAMRHAHTGGDARRVGLQGGGAPLVIYASVEAHSCVEKAAILLGFGSDHLRRIPVDDARRIELGALARAIAEDRRAGLRPACVVASAGTVNTGAVDPFDALADLCARERLWLHVDGAYGALGRLARPELYRGLERADSLAIDPHKWMYIPVECGCALVRDAALLRAAYSLVPAYLRDDAEDPWFAEYGVQQTRGFRALKLWMVLQQVGAEGYRALVRRDIALAAALARMIDEHPALERRSDGPLSVVCFRHRAPPGPDGDALQRAIADAVNRSGEAFITTTCLDGQIVLRACVVNFRTRRDDLARLVAAVARAGARA